MIYITNAARSTELVMLFSYPASLSRIIVLLKTPRSQLFYLEFIWHKMATCNKFWCKNRMIDKMSKYMIDDADNGFANSLNEIEKESSKRKECQYLVELQTKNTL